MKKRHTTAEVIETYTTVGSAGLAIIVALLSSTTNANVVCALVGALVLLVIRMFVWQWLSSFPPSTSELIENDNLVGLEGNLEDRMRCFFINDRFLFFFHQQKKRRATKIY